MLGSRRVDAATKWRANGSERVNGANREAVRDGHSPSGELRDQRVSRTSPELSRHFVKAKCRVFLSDVFPGSGRRGDLAKATRHRQLVSVWLQLNQRAALSRFPVVLRNADKSIGAEARPFFKLAVDLSSIFKERAEIA